MTVWWRANRVRGRWGLGGDVMVDRVSVGLSAYLGWWQVGVELNWAGRWRWVRVRRDG